MLKWMIVPFIAGALAAQQVDLTINVKGILPVANGGTGASSAGAALTSLGAAAASTLSSHTGNTSNPHSVTATQVGKDTAQWNALKIFGKEVDSTSCTSPTDTHALKYSTSAGKWTCAADEVGEPGSGEANTASNVGSTGTGVFKQKSSLDLQFYKLASANSLLTIALEGTDYVKFTSNAESPLTFSSPLSRATNTISLSASGVGAGTYGSATQSPVFTVDTYGRITGVVNTTISGVTPAAHNHAASEITSGQLAIAQGGTSASSAAAARTALGAAAASDLTSHTSSTSGVHGSVSTLTANRIVERDSYGNFAANKITLGSGTAGATLWPFTPATMAAPDNLYLVRGTDAAAMNTSFPAMSIVANVTSAVPENHAELMIHQRRTNGHAGGIAVSTQALTADYGTIGISSHSILGNGSSGHTSTAFPLWTSCQIYNAYNACSNEMNMGNFYGADPSNYGEYGTGVINGLALISTGNKKASSAIYIGTQDSVNSQIYRGIDFEQGVIPTDGWPIVFPNNRYIASRNAANSAKIDMFKINGTNDLEFKTGGWYFWNNSSGTELMRHDGTNLKLASGQSFAIGSATGVTGTIVVKGSDGNNCNLVFTGGILTSETCP